MIKALILFTFFFTQLLFAKNESTIIIKALGLNLDKSKEWINLLHYKKSIWGNYNSQADSKSFFLSPVGKSSPRDELVSTLSAIIDASTIEIEHTQCKFPARTMFFRKYLPEYKHLFNINCPLFEKYKKKISAKSVSIVFSSYYLDNPSSAYGHTLMRFSKQEESHTGENYELLDYAINYSANVTTSSTFLYSLMGLIGGFEGEFASIPYFYKIREYNDFESRDLWDYQLNLTKQELSLLLAHVYEMRQTIFDYYYFTENCSYHMLSLLDVVNPNWNLTSINPTLVIPIDTIQTLFKSNGLVRKVSFRPSKLRIIKQRLKELNHIEKISFDEIIKSKTINFTEYKLSKESQAKILDSAIDFIDFKYAEEILMKDSEISNWKRELLIARSKVNHKSNNLLIKFPEKEQPQNGHPSRRLAIGYGSDEFKNNIINIEYRATLHDLLDSNIGHNKDSLLEMGHIKLNYFPKNKVKNNSKSLELDYASLFHIISLSPYQEYISKLSWKAQLGFRKLHDDQCRNCDSPFAEFGAGLSYRFMGIIFYAMMKTEIEISSDFLGRGYRVGLGPESTIVSHLGEYFSILLSGEYMLKYARQEEWISKFSAKIRMRYSSNKSIELDYTKYQSHWKILSKYYFYF